ncbi:tetratricopeptide repeat protein [Variovorax sp. W6]|uniref:tetratricopeptide repeat protein n=1 Tax=Variovorax sp. W6 TaxID=3093895 RepID=UPI003D8021F8
MKNLDLRFSAIRVLPALLIFPFLLQLPVSHATENHAMDKPDAAPTSSSPISGAQSYALTDAQRVDLAAKAEAGDAEAAFRLSLYYTFVSSDEDQRIRWLSIAAKGGHVVAQHNLAYDLYMNGKDLAEAARWAAESLKNGNADAGDLLKEIEAARAKARGARP